MNFTIGADPEVFLYDASAKRAIPATLCFFGNKSKPEPLDCGTVIHDNVAAEFTVPAVNNCNDFVEVIGLMRRAVLEAARTRLANDKIVLDFGSSSRIWKPKDLTHPDTMVFGCDPDFNAWQGGEKNPKPNPESLAGLRSTGGHIHIGVDDEWFQRKPGQLELVRVLDASVGQVIANWEHKGGNGINHRRRRTMYGAAGCYRPKPYGVEYRSPSPVWCSSDDRARIIYDVIEKVIKHVKDYGNESLEKILTDTNVTAVKVQEAVNNSRPIRELLDYWD